jgi:superfamily II DNA/RNA helicase
MQLLTQQRIICNGLAQVRFEELWPTCSRARPDAALLEGLFAPKLLELRRLIADLVVEQERKVVVFSQWRRMLRLAEWSVRDVLASAGFGAVFFTGAEKPAQRTRSIVDFHDDPRIRLMFLSDAGGVGLNLQRAANACINLELPWNPAVLEQRIGRIYRLGQKHPIDVFNLVSEAGIESRIAEIVGTKQALFSGLFDGTSDEIRFDGAASFLTRVERLLDPGPVPEAPRGAVAEASDEGEVDDSEDDSSREQSSALSVPSLVTDGSRDHAAAPAPAESVAVLLRSLRVERTSDGSVRFEAPPEAAGSLIALFEGMARLLQQQSP